MVKPSKKEIEHALAAAEYLRARNNDAHDMAKTLLYFSERNGYLEKVLEAAEIYVRFGQGAINHARLMRAIDAAKVSRDAAVRPQEMV